MAAPLVVGLVVMFGVCGSCGSRVVAVAANLSVCSVCEAVAMRPEPPAA